MPVSSADVEAARRAHEYGKFTLILYVLGTVFFVIYYAYIVVYFGSALSNPAYGYPQYPASGVGGLLGVGLVFFIVIVAIFAYSIVKIRDAFMLMADKGSLFGRPLMLVNIGAVCLAAGGVISIIGVFGSLGLPLVLGFVLLAVGAIAAEWGIALGLWRLGSIHNNAVLKIGAILAVFCGLAGILLVYLGTDEIERFLALRGQKMQKRKDY